jgi:hypothetical protein
VRVDIDHSKIFGSRFYNLWINNVTPLAKLDVKVQDSDLSTSTSGVAVAFDQQTAATTQDVMIDLGGGALGSEGRNIFQPDTTVEHRRWITIAQRTVRLQGTAGRLNAF